MPTPPDEQQANSQPPETFWSNTLTGHYLYQAQAAQNDFDIEATKAQMLHYMGDLWGSKPGKKAEEPVKQLEESICGYNDHLAAHIRINSSQVKCIRCQRMFASKTGIRAKKSWVNGSEFFIKPPTVNLTPPTAPPDDVDMSFDEDNE